MSDGREGFKEIIKNNEYNNISLRIINDRKREGIKNVIDHTKKTKQNISIKIPQKQIDNEWKTADHIKSRHDNHAASHHLSVLHFLASS